MYKTLLILALVLGVVGSSALADLRGHWELDGDGLDSSGYGNNGTAVNTPTPTADRFGNPDSAMLFDGGDDAFDCGNDWSVQIEGAMTITAWVYLDGTSTNNGRILSKLGIPGGTVDWSYSMNIENSVNGVTNPVTFMVGTDNTMGGLIQLNDDAPLPTDQWVHMAGVFTPGESLQIFLNGDLAVSMPISFTTQWGTGPSPLYIGNFIGAGDVGWKGKLDDIRLYSDAKTQAEIQAIMTGVPVVKANTPSPSDAATGVGINAVLSWTAGAYAVSHDVYFGMDQNAVINAQRLLGDFNLDGKVDIEDIKELAQNWLTGTNLNDFVTLANDWGNTVPTFKGNQSGTTFNPGTLTNEITYYWRIDEVNGAEPDSPWTGDVWSFTTEDFLPGQASIPSPGDGASGVGVDDDLSWVAGSGATLHAVYFGQDSTPDEGEFQGNQTGVTFELGTMEEGQTYYWRVDEINDYGTTTGTVWSFTTVITNIVNIMPLGDSITQGYTTYDNYRHLLWDKLQANGYTNINFVGSHDVLAWNTADSLVFDKDHEGHYGWQTDEIRDGGGVPEGGSGNLNSWLSSLQSTGEVPDIVLMHLGTNDVVHNPSGYDQNITIGEMEDVIDILRSYNPNVTILLAQIIPHKNASVPSIDSLNALIPSLDSYETATSEVIIVDHYTGFSTSWLADDYHPNTTGAIEMSDRWYDALTPLLTPVPRVIVCSDIGGGDPDDFQSMVHYLVNADRFDTEGLISSPPMGGRVTDILATLDAYETDYNNLNSHADFPTPQSLRDVSKQGAINASPSAGYSTATEGSNWIISCANSSDPRPLWILVWGSITDVAQAVHDDPSIKSKIRVYSIGSWNTDQDPYARNYLYNNHSDLWWIENDTTFFGMFWGGDQSGDFGNSTFVEQNVRYHGALGDFYYSKMTYIKMGDTPSVLYMLNGDRDDPTTAHWGGMFGTTGHGTNYWHDLTDPQYAEVPWYGWTTEGAKTVNVHREEYLRDWQTRMDWADAP